MGKRNSEDDSERSSNEYGVKPVSDRKGIPVDVEKDGKVVERDSGRGYNGPSENTPVYVDSHGKVYTEPGEGRKRLTPVPAFISEDGMLYAHGRKHTILFREEKDGSLHYVVKRRDGHEDKRGGVESKVSAAIGFAGILIGLLGISPGITGNVIGGSGSYVLNIPSILFLAVGLLGIGFYFYFKSKV